ncbi:PREDICTED: uncharacterized protein LOC109473345 [Branchiostoma belcheri]|uniref:Uncharacterized protein LOC109473345 n=1 Tax=Branchiostoma belcheri TaxID=7741 RepID=A0A6P4Z4B0_BRABE|nr:PREDICTED: uncharacterized protein LOC109473345 [Branchiostoma belcheri]
MAKNVSMEVLDTEVMGNSEDEGGNTFKLQARVEKKPQELLPQRESKESAEASAQTDVPSEGDELAELYESRKAAVPPPPVVRPKEPRPQPADALACRPPDPLYVRRVGQRFWSTRRILDWQRQALRARGDPEAVLKPVQEYGEDSAPRNLEIGENDEEHAHYEDREQGHYENDEEHKYYQYDKNHARNENDQEHRHYENDGEQGHYENDEEQKHYENDEEHALYENDEDHSNLSTHVYADLDPDFLAAQDAIKNATAQPFYEMDITPTNDEQEQPFYKMDVTAAEETGKQEQPFYEMNVASADENSEQVFYRMDADQLAQPTPSENAYEDLDADFLAAQDVVDRRHGVGEPSRGDGNSRCSQNCSKFCRSRPGRMVALCVGVIIAGIAATIVAVIINQHKVLSVHPEENMVVHWWREWTLYVRAYQYFQQNKDTAAGLEERYPGNEVVMVLLEDRFFWPIVCRHWEIYRDLPKTLDTAVGYGIEYGISREYRMAHGLSAYSEFFSSMLNALEALRNKTKALPNRYGEMRLSLSGHALLDTDVEALVNLFPYLEGTTELYLFNCRISADAATLLAGQLHLLHTLTKLLLSHNEIGDEGVAAIADTFPHLKELQVLYLAKTSITNAGGRAIARRLVHLQQLQELRLQENELALSVSALARAFANMTRLEYVRMWPVTCSAASLHMATQQVRDAVHTLAGQLVAYRWGTQLYDGSSSKAVAQGLDTAWRQVKDKLTTGVAISSRKLKIEFKLLVPDAGDPPPRG